MGEYQCQVNTEPKISMSVFLHVTGLWANHSGNIIVLLVISLQRLELVFMTLMAGIRW